MKIIKQFLVCVFVAVILYIAYKMYSDSNNARLIELEKNTIELKKEIEKVSNDCDSLKVELDIVKCNTDTLKKGQSVIYNEVKKSNESFWSKLF